MVKDLESTVRGARSLLDGHRLPKAALWPHNSGVAPRKHLQFITLRPGLRGNVSRARFYGDGAAGF